ncbi:MAG: aminotransferase class V-fold PLP-dependent enzyme, partial [Oscillospiraceae bacterium]|nr:aminotransferase class V-fold PLP-dependent enzyme [Oscillospiraceae bacterium]
MIYLDNAATTIQKPSCVAEAVVNAMGNLGNSGRGVHGTSLTASRVIYDTRAALAALFNAPSPARVAFTSNSTEALNTAIMGLFSAGDHVISTDLEHN